MTDELEKAAKQDRENRHWDSEKDAGYYEQGFIAGAEYEAKKAAALVEAIERWQHHWCDDYLPMIYEDMAKVLAKYRGEHD